MTNYESQKLEVCFSRVISIETNGLGVQIFWMFLIIDQNVCQILTHQSKLGEQKSKYHSRNVPERGNNQNIIYCPTSYSCFTNAQRLAVSACQVTDEIGGGARELIGKGTAWVPIFLDVVNERTSFASCLRAF